MLLLNFARCWLYFKPSSGWWFGTYFIFPYIGSRCHHAQHVPHKGTIYGTKCHACHAKTHLASQPRARVISEETRPRHIRGKFPRHNRGAFPAKGATLHWEDAIEGCNTSREGIHPLSFQTSSAVPNHDFPRCNSALLFQFILAWCSADSNKKLHAKLLFKNHQ